MAAIPLAYILPGLAYIRIAPHSLYSREKMPAIGLVVFGLIVTLAGAAFLLPSLGGGCRSDFVFDYCKNYDNDSIVANVTTAATKMIKRST